MELVPTWAITLKRLFVAFTHASRTALRSSTVSDSDSPVVPHTNTPAICDVAIWSAYWEMIGRFSSPSVLNGVKVAATIPFRR